MAAQRLRGRALQPSTQKPRFSAVGLALGNSKDMMGAAKPIIRSAAIAAASDRVHELVISACTAGNQTDVVLHLV